MLYDVNDWNFRWILFDSKAIFLTNQCPELLNIECWTEFVITDQVEVPHTNFTEVSRMVFVIVDTMMVHATGITTTSRMFTVFTLKFKGISTVNITSEFD